MKAEKINISNVNKSTLIAKLFVYCKENSNYCDISENELRDKTKKFTHENFIFIDELTENNIITHLILFLIGSEKSVFNQFI